MIGRIGIIGDVHAQDDRLRQALCQLEKLGVDQIVCTGDLPDGIGDLEESCRLLQKEHVLTVRGNHDRWLLDGVKRDSPKAHARESLGDNTLQFLMALPVEISLETKLGELMLFHGVLKNDMGKVWPGTDRSPIQRNDDLDFFLSDEKRRPKFLVNGHIHFRSLIDFDNCHLINGGTLRGRWSGFSVLDLNDRTLTGFDFVEGACPKRSRQYDLDDVSNRTIWGDTRDFDGRWSPAVLHAA